MLLYMFHRLLRWRNRFGAGVFWRNCHYDSAFLSQLPFWCSSFCARGSDYNLSNTKRFKINIVLFLSLYSSIVSEVYISHHFHKKITFKWFWLFHEPIIRTIDGCGVCSMCSGHAVSMVHGSNLARQNPPPSWMRFGLGQKHVRHTNYERSDYYLRQ